MEDVQRSNVKHRSMFAGQFDGLNISAGIQRANDRRSVRKVPMEKSVQFVNLIRRELPAIKAQPKSIDEFELT